jgi:single-strand DNA-binding protein
MSDLNNCAFTGNLTKDAELKLIGAKQTPCCEFTIANNTGFGQYAKASFIAVQLWGQSASALKEYLKKGTKVAVAGEFTQNDWTDQNGVKHSMWRLSASRVTLLGSSNRNTETTVDSSNEEETVF